MQLKCFTVHVIAGLDNPRLNRSKSDKAYIGNLKQMQKLNFQNSNLDTCSRILNFLNIKESPVLEVILVRQSGGEQKGGASSRRGESLHLGLLCLKPWLVSGGGGVGREWGWGVSIVF